MQPSLIFIGAAKVPQLITGWCFATEYIYIEDPSHVRRGSRATFVAAMSFEVFAEIGLELKQRSPIRPLMNISIANGSHGYLPTPEQHRLGGYETWIGVNQVELDASVKMVDALIEMLGALKSEKQ